MVMAAGSVMKEPRMGPMVKMAHHQAVSVPPNRLAIFHMNRSVICRIGRVAARVMITTTNIGSVKFTLYRM